MISSYTRPYESRLFNNPRNNKFLLSASAISIIMGLYYIVLSHYRDSKIQQNRATDISYCKSICSGNRDLENKVIAPNTKTLCSKLLAELEN